MRKTLLVALGVLMAWTVFATEDPFITTVSVNGIDFPMDIVEVDDSYFISLSDLRLILPNVFFIKEGKLYIDTKTQSSIPSISSSGSGGSYAPPSSTYTSSSGVESRIDGEFGGWSGDTMFKLQNGQIWQQAEIGYHYAYLYSPKVTIVRSGAYWIMSVAGVNKTLRVSRIK